MEGTPVPGTQDAEVTDRLHAPDDVPVAMATDPASRLGEVVFQPLARALLDGPSSSQVVTSILTRAIESLLLQGWPDPRVSLDLFADHREVVKAFDVHGITPTSDEPARAGVARLQQLLDQIDSFPWFADGGFSLNRRSPRSEGGGHHHYAYVDGASVAEVEFIALVSQQLPRIVEELRELRGRVEGLEK